MMTIPEVTEDATANTLRMVTSKTIEKLASKKTSKRSNACKMSLEIARSLFSNEEVSLTVEIPLLNKRITVKNVVNKNTTGELQSLRQKLRRHLLSEVTCAKPKINLSKDQASTKPPLVTAKSPKKQRNIVKAKILNFRKRDLLSL